MPSPLLLRAIASGALAVCCLPAAAADGRDLAADTAQCKAASDRQVVAASCSTVIALSREPRLLERAYNRRGAAEEANGQFDAAASDYSQVIRLNPKIAGYFDNRMRAYKALGRLDLALKDADTAVAMAPTYAFVLHGRGAVRYDRGDYGLAVNDFSAALAINAADASLLVDRGRAFAKLGQTGDAIADFTQALAVAPGLKAALRERGLASAQVGDAEGARADLAQAVAADPADGEAAGVLRSLGGGSPAAAPERVAQDEGASPDVERAEAEARQKLQAMKDAETARTAAGRQLREERLARARTEAGRVRGEASDFVKANRDDPQLMDHLQHIADLGAALPGTDPAAIERGTALLTAGLAADPLYAAVAERRKVERAREDERTLGEALRTLAVQKRFLVGRVVQDPTGGAAPGFLSLAKQADAVLTSPDLDRAQTVMGTIDAAIAKAGMSDGYAAERQAAAAEEQAGRGKAAAAKPAP